MQYRGPRRVTQRMFEDTLPCLQSLTAQGWQHVVLSHHVPELPALPGWLDAWNNLGLAQIQQGRNATAVRTFNRLLALDRRGCLEAYGNLGVAYLNLGSAEEAERVLRQGLA